MIENELIVTDIVDVFVPSHILRPTWIFSSPMGSDCFNLGLKVLRFVLTLSKYPY